MGQTKRYNTKVKIGRGFSIAELKDAGLTMAFAETQAANVKRLTDYKSKLILFPSKEGKNVVKNGMIPDSTADKLKNVEQNITPSVFALPAVDKSVKSMAITKEMSEFKAYQKLRHERINKYYEGKRIKRAKDAEAAKK